MVCEKSDKRIDLKRNRYCQNCSIRKKAVEFERKVIRGWEEWLGKDAETLLFRKMKDHFMVIRQAMNVERGKRSLATHHFIQIYEGEKDRFTEVTRTQTAS